MAERDERLDARALGLSEPQVGELALDAPRDGVVGHDKARVLDAEVAEALVGEHRAALLADADVEPGPLRLRPAAAATAATAAAAVIAAPPPQAASANASAAISAMRVIGFTVR